MTTVAVLALGVAAVMIYAGLTGADVIGQARAILRGEPVPATPEPAPPPTPVASSQSGAFAPPPAQPGGFRRPHPGPIVSPFGNRVHPVTGGVRFHAGVDIDGAEGDPIVAAQAGRVAYAGTAGNYGYLIKLEHAGGFETRYAHLHSFKVRAGAHVLAGQLIALMGGRPGHPGAGNSTGDHLHFEIRSYGEPVDPARFIGG